MIRKFIEFILREENNMCLIVVIISLIGYYLVVFVKFEDEIYDVSNDIMLWDIVFELKFLVFD